MKNRIELFHAIATLVGTIIGAGILGIPYVFAKAGFWTGTAMLAFITFALVSMKLMFGEMTLRTQGKHQVPGYVEEYLGTFWKNVVSVVLVLTITGSLLAYFVGIGEVLAAVFGGESFWWGMGFYIVGAFSLLFGITLIKRVELILTLFIFLIVAAISLLSSNHADLSNLTDFSWSKIFIPYGVILFACSGIIAVPQARRILYKCEHLLKKAIFIGALIPPLIYLLFAWIVISVSGVNTTEIATVGLGQATGKEMIIAGNIFAFLAMATSFLTLGLALKGVYHYDFKIKHITAWLLAITFPLIIYAMGLTNFIQIISLAGALGFGVNGVIYIFTYWAARKKGKRKPEYTLSKTFALPVSVLLIAVFIFGLFYTISNY